MNWEEYENITKYIYEELGRASGVKVIGYGKNFKLKGKSGVLHQVDVLTSHSDGIHDYLTAVECKYWEKKINKDVVMKVVSIIDDTNIHKGVIVSKRGFTEDGISFAKHKNIGLIELKEIETDEQIVENKEKSFLIGELTLNIKINQSTPKILNIDFDFVDMNQKSNLTGTTQIVIRLQNGKEVALNSYLLSFKEKLQKVEPGKKIKKYYALENANLICNNKEIFKIKGFTLIGELELKNIHKSRQFNIVDEIWLIMKSLFENNSYTISKLGLIKKVRN
ncbi:restriction endonuclease [Flagellimonas sp. GZD32]|uniref:restriction endonuclease n=1 Tax=Flagellimonas cixiensis TaxID=3228750 RepID=UPI0035C8A381